MKIPIYCKCGICMGDAPIAQTTAGYVRPIFTIEFRVNSKEDHSWESKIIPICEKCATDPVGSMQVWDFRPNMKDINKPTDYTRASRVRQIDELHRKNEQMMKKIGEFIDDKCDGNCDSCELNEEEKEAEKRYRQYTNDPITIRDDLKNIDAPAWVRNILGNYRNTIMYRKKGITDLVSFCDKMTDVDVLKMPRVGPRTLIKLKIFLDQHGYFLKAPTSREDISYLKYAYQSDSLLNDVFKRIGKNRAIEVTDFVNDGLEGHVFKMWKGKEKIK